MHHETGTNDERFTSEGVTVLIIIYAYQQNKLFSFSEIAFFGTSREDIFYALEENLSSRIDSKSCA